MWTSHSYGASIDQGVEKGLSRESNYFTLDSLKIDSMQFDDLVDDLLGTVGGGDGNRRLRGAGAKELLTRRIWYSYKGLYADDGVFVAIQRDMIDATRELDYFSTYIRLREPDKSEDKAE
ncbi:hypothetical protein BHM03_00016981 [Ensete ventricosum]|nr:hypothetical protein BHM03_00016981 [Ensete ventricosum]